MAEAYNGIVNRFSLYISKATLENNVMRWAAVNSDTDKDSYQERMSIDLYNDFGKYISGKKELPAEFKSLVVSDYWTGGMPYLSISHYPDLNGKAVPGEPIEVFVDGNKLKAKGILFDTPLGHSVYRSLKEDKNKPTENKIRISIGFLDLAHKHGENGEVWVRESAYSLCPECLEGVGNKVYMQGCLVHLALTRVPVNKRTEMVIEEKSMAKKITRKEDAASIVGEREAEEIEKISKATTQKSDILIEMSDAESKSGEVESTSAVPAEDAVEPVAEPVAEPVVEPVPEAVVEESTAEENVAEKVEKSEDSVAANALDESATYVDNMPFGGATSMKDAENYVAAKNEAIYLMDMWSVFSNVVWNIMDRADVTDKRSAVNNAVDEFKNVLTAKAMVAFSATEGASPIGENVELSDLSETHSPQHPLQPALDAILNAVDNSLTLESDVSGKLTYINAPLQELGQAITDFVTTKSVAKEPTAPDKNDDILAEMKNILQPIAEGLKSLSERVGVVEAKSQAQVVETKSRIPQSRTFKSSVIQQTPQEKIEPTSLKAIVRKSVGLN